MSFGFAPEAAKETGAGRPPPSTPIWTMRRCAPPLPLPDEALDWMHGTPGASGAPEDGAPPKPRRFDGLVTG